MDYLKISHELSLAGTIPTIWLAAVVLRIWGKDAAAAIRKQKTAVSWMLIGVVISFLGSHGDNIYWGIAWVHSYLESPEKEWWFKHGVFSNLIFRQGAGTIAAYCHVRSATEFMRNKGVLKGYSANLHLFYSSAVGILFLLLLRYLGTL